ncbi:MAG: hypothetical protein H6627_01495 [Calditrichae bacterium]|nr:hypothetical protein [Calditrichia bacterium]
MNRSFINFVVILFLLSSYLLAGDEWFRIYDEGLKASESGNYELAVAKFKQALEIKDTDNKHIRTYGMHFIEYYPNREIGIALYNLGRKSEALTYLKLSAKTAPSGRAEEYLNKLQGIAPVEPAPVTITETPKNNEANNKMIVGKKTVKLVGERMGVAVLPFENKGASKDLGEIVLDKMITALFNQGRFKVIERTQLDKILQEQQLSMSGVVDASTAAEIGKGIGVDAIIIGSVAAAKSGAISLDARAIDTESATIIVAHDAYSGSADAMSVKNAVENLANKITESLPLVEGTVIGINQDGTILLDAGRMAGVKKGLKCVVYQEGPELKHPITGEVLGKRTKIIAEVLVVESLEKFSTAKMISNESGELISMGDKFLTK